MSPLVDGRPASAISGERTKAMALASVLGVVCVTVHLAEDIARGLEPGGVTNLVAVPLMVLWLYGSVVLPGRVWGYLITLLGSLFGGAAPLVHFLAAGGVLAGGRIGTPGAVGFVATLLASGVASLLAAVLSAEGLWNSWLARGRGRRRLPSTPASP